MPKSYWTILRQGEAELVEKKSRFIGTCRPVKSEAEAKAFLEEMKKKYWDATHNVWAYQLGERNEIQRYSDDGEPQGTAGLPVLDVLRGESLRNVAVVVTRYFGGTLLGTGGLVRAYGRSARESLLAAGILKMTRYLKYRVETDYPTSGKLQYEIQKDEHILADIAYTDRVVFTVYVEGSQDDAFVGKMRELSGGQAGIVLESEVFGAWMDGMLKIPD